MRTRRLRNWQAKGAVSVVVVVALWLLYLLYHAKNRADLSAYWAVPLAAVSIISGLFAWAWRKDETRQQADTDDSKHLDHAADQLASATQILWTTAAQERGLAGDAPIIPVTWGKPSKAVSGPVAAAIGASRFDPLPGLPPTEEADLSSGNASELHALYGGLRSGRLIIIGPPGSGKSGAAVRLVLDALRHRDLVPAEQQPRVSVPVLLTAQDWDPENQPVTDWLIGKLQDTHPNLFATRSGKQTAAALLERGRVTIILDGLDEISPCLQPIALKALSQQSTFRLILLSRTDELAAAASHGHLQGAAAVELNPVSPEDAASFLEGMRSPASPDGWDELTSHLRTDSDSPLSRALTTPLTLTLVRDTYQRPDSVHELLHYCDTTRGLPPSQAVREITSHLLGRVLRAAYTRRPGPEPLPYDLETAHRTLAAIAAQMNRTDTRDLNWWQIPTWASSKRGLGARHRAIGNARPPVMGDLTLAKALTPRNLAAGLAAGLTVGLTGGLAAGAFVLVAGLPVVLPVGLAFVLPVGLAFVLISVVEDSLTASPDSNFGLTPAISWQRNRNYGLAIGLAFGFAVGLAFGFAVGLGAGFPGGFAVGLGVGLAGGLSDTHWYKTSRASRELARRWGTPKRLMKFLEDAHSRNVLRTVGPTYQFRHALLQDQLAADHAQRDREG